MIHIFLLADDHSILRKALKTLIAGLYPHVQIDEGWDADSVLKKIKKTDYQLIILDTKMSGKDSFGLVSDILNIKPHTNILMLALNVSDAHRKKYLQLHAKGYISKTAPSEEIKNVIDLILKC